MAKFPIESKPGQAGPIRTADRYLDSGTRFGHDANAMTESSRRSIAALGWYAEEGSGPPLQGTSVYTRFTPNAALQAVIEEHRMDTATR